MAINTKRKKEPTLFNRPFNTRIFFLLLFYLIGGLILLWGLIQLIIYFNPFKGNIAW